MTSSGSVVGVAATWTGEGCGATWSCGRTGRTEAETSCSCSCSCSVGKTCGELAADAGNLRNPIQMILIQRLSEI